MSDNFPGKKPKPSAHANPDPDQALLPKEAFLPFAEGLDHPEGLAFDNEEQLWAGGELGQIYRIDVQGTVQEIARLGGFCLGLTFSTEQELWVCNSGLHSLIRVDRAGRVLDSIESIDGRSLVTPNFSVFDRAGNLYFSDSGNWDGGDGCVYVRRPNGHAKYFAGPFAFANGLAMSAEERYLFVVESQRDRVLRLELLENGMAGETEIYAEDLGRVPDGLVFDAEGNLYVTCYASDCIYLVTPQRSVRLLVCDSEGTRIARPTNAAFGGPDFDEMYVANFGRWHIGRTRLKVRGQPLVNF